jgi:hypothetical protein
MAHDSLAQDLGAVGEVCKLVVGHGSTAAGIVEVLLHISLFQNSNVSKTDLQFSFLKLVCSVYSPSSVNGA